MHIPYANDSKRVIYNSLCIYVLIYIQIVKGRANAAAAISPGGVAVDGALSVSVVLAQSQSQLVWHASGTRRTHNFVGPMQIFVQHFLLTV